MTVTESDPSLAGLRAVDFSSQIAGPYCSKLLVDRAVRVLRAPDPRLLFETDFPHPTCTYPDGVGLALDSLAGLDEHVAAALMGGNAARLYNVAG